jgi:hypothetical protein
VVHQLAVDISVDTR